MGRLTRREFTKASLAASAAAWIGPPQTPAPAAPQSPAPSPAQDAMDEALALLEGTGMEYRGGLANHGPMAAEAIATLQRPEAVVPWVARYKRALEPAAKASTPIDAARWRDALGDRTRLADWAAYFDRELEEKPWRDVVEIWSARLAPGFVAVAMHGVIRTGHAARSLAAHETPRRKRELAQGLGYWAGHFTKLPEAAAPAGARAKPADALKRVETLEPKHSAPNGFITDALRALDQLPTFPQVIELVDASGDPSAFLAEVTETFSHAYLGKGPRRPIAFVHAVTGPSAARLLLPYVKPDTGRSLARYAWQAAAGLYAAFAVPSDAEPATLPMPRDAAALVDAAIANGDEHAIKLTEACLREHAVNRKPIYLAAAQDAVTRLG